MKYGIYYAYWERQWGADYRKYVEKVARLGFDILEISCAGLCDMDPRELEEIRELKEKHGITLTGGYGPRAEEDISSGDPAVVEHALDFWDRTFRVLQQLGVSQVGGGLYGHWPVDYSRPMDKEASWARGVEGVRRMADLADSYGISLGMEVLNRHEGFLLNVAEEGVRFVREVGRSNVKVMLDTYHMNLEEEDMPGAIRTAGELLGHFHVGEISRRLPGEGKRINWREIGGTLREIGYDGTVVMEPFVLMGGQVGSDIRVWRDLSGGATEQQLDEAAARSVAFLREAFAPQGQ